MKHRMMLNVLVAVALAAVGLGARAQTGYTFKDLGRVGGYYATATGVNSLGQAVGGYELTIGSGFRVFLHLPAPAYGLPAGANDIGTLGSSIATDINDSGEVVGRDSHAFIWVPTARYGLPAGMSDLNVLPQFGAAGVVATSAWSINNNHVIAGQAIRIADNLGCGFILDLITGTFTNLGASMTTATCINNNGMPQAIGTQQIYDVASATFTSIAPLLPRGINNSGAIAATNLVGGNYHAFYRDPFGVLTDLGGLAYNASRANGINNAGTYPAAVMVGYTYTSQAMAIAFRWRVGSSVMQDLNKITTGRGKFVLVEATAVSDSGHIVGYATIQVKGVGEQHAFLLTPQ